MTKEEIRRHIKAQKTLLTAAERLAAATAVFDRLEQSAAFKVADRILMYHSLPDELSTREFIDKWAGRKHFYLPRVNGVNLDILPYDRTRMALGAFHIEEPQGDDTVAPGEIELVVVPAVAYDRHGNRVGRGKGFYDRLLHDIRATKIGVCYDFQLLEDIPADPHDVPVDFVISQTAHITVRPRSDERRHRL